MKNLMVIVGLILGCCSVSFVDAGKNDGAKAAKKSNAAADKEVVAKKKTWPAVVVKNCSPTTPTSAGRSPASVVAAVRPGVSPKSLSGLSPLSITSRISQGAFPSAPVAPLTQETALKLFCNERRDPDLVLFKTWVLDALKEKKWHMLVAWMRAGIDRLRDFKAFVACLKGLPGATEEVFSAIFLGMVGASNFLSSLRDEYGDELAVVLKAEGMEGAAIVVEAHKQALIEVAREKGVTCVLCDKKFDISYHSRVFVLSSGQFIEQECLWYIENNRRHFNIDTKGIALSCGDFRAIARMHERRSPVREASSSSDR